MKLEYCNFITTLYKMENRLVSPLIAYLRERDMIAPTYDTPGTRVKSVYLPFSASGITQNTYYFDPDSMIDGKNAIIKGIEIVDNTTQAVQFSGGAYRDNLSAANYANGYFIASNVKRERIAEIPLYSLIRRLNNGLFYFTHWDDHVWQTCGVEFTNASSLTSSVGIQMLIYYQPKNEIQ